MTYRNSVGNVQLMQKLNRLNVLNCIRHRETVSRPEIAEITGLSPSTVTNIVSYLLDKNLITEIGPVDTREVGRKAALIRFNPEAMSIVSVNIEVSKVDIALTDLDGNVILKKEVMLEYPKREYEILNLLKRELKALLSECRQSTKAIAAVGIAVSGVVGNEGNLVISSSLKLKGLSFKDNLEKSLNIPVYVQNNSMTKAMSELKRKGKEIERNIIFLDLTIGVGIINFFEGRINEAVIGELGHTTVKKDGPLCFCGNRGCLEMMCSVETIIERCTELLQQKCCPILGDIAGLPGNTCLTYEAVLDAFEKGDRDVARVLKECGEYLGIGIANIINLFKPQRIIINGDLLLESDFVFRTALEEADKRANGQFLKELKYERVNVGPEQALKGVSLYVADRFFELSGPDF